MEIAPSSSGFIAAPYINIVLETIYNGECWNGKLKDELERIAAGVPVWSFPNQKGDKSELAVAWKSFNHPKRFSLTYAFFSELLHYLWWKYLARQGLIRIIHICRHLDVYWSLTETHFWGLRACVACLQPKSWKWRIGHLCRILLKIQMSFAPNSFQKC